MPATSTKNDVAMCTINRDLNVFLGFVYAAIISVAISSVGGSRGETVPPCQILVVLFCCAYLAIDFLARFIPWNRIMQQSDHAARVKSWLILIRFFTDLACVTLMGLTFCFAINLSDPPAILVSHNQLFLRLFGVFLICTFVSDHVLIFAHEGDFLYLRQAFTTNDYQKPLREMFPRVEWLAQKLEVEYKFVNHFVKSLRIIVSHYSIWHITYLNLLWGVVLLCNQSPNALLSSHWSWLKALNVKNVSAPSQHWLAILLAAVFVVLLPCRIFRRLLLWFAAAIVLPLVALFLPPSYVFRIAVVSQLAAGLVGIVLYLEPVAPRGVRRK